MEINEAVAMLEKTLEEDDYCGDEENRNPGWKVVIDGVKGVGDAKVLKNNMIEAGETKINEADKLQLPEGWDLFTCGTLTFPVQTHHLICEKYLPTHQVTVWLTDSPPEKHPEYILESDTSYDTNGAKNGYFMPFASSTAQWNQTKRTTKHDNICFEMMRLTLIQLHQGPHSSTNYLENYQEEENVETGSYKGQLDDFLTMIYKRMEVHVKGCKYCKGKKKGGRIKVQPLEATVRHMELVSFLMKTLIGFWRICVSKRAKNYYINNNEGGKVIYPNKAFISKQDI